ncbi:MAG: hypothetical protein GY827_11325 [Cytophagales bacterium]|nr:hypothetical protein [Cytophagales bacterium]
MLVIISDLHLTDGSSGTTIGSRAFKIFRQNLRDLAYEASFSKTESGETIYEPIKSLDIVLLGDILDIIRSSKWLDEDVRPWDDPYDGNYVRKVKEINKGILEHNKESLDILKSLKDGREGGITLPPADGNAPKQNVGHHFSDNERVPVNVNIYYLVGNHDWFYHLKDKGGSKVYDSVRQDVIDALGLSQDSNPFPHNPHESEALIASFKRHNVFARHGDIFDPFNYTGDRDKSSLGDAIVVELLNRFPTLVEKKLTEKYQSQPDLLEQLKPCFEGLKETDNVRPLLYIPIWVDGLLERTCKGHPKIIDEIKEIWNQLCDDFLKIDFVKSFDKWYSPIDSYDQLEYGLKFSEHLSFDRISRLINLFKQNDQKIDSYADKAIEQLEKSETSIYDEQNAKYIVYGHTHYSEVVALDADPIGNQAFGQMYINSGTWRQVYRLTKKQRSKQTFLGYKVMTYLSFYAENERKEHEFEVWNGTLG